MFTLENLRETPGVTLRDPADDHVEFDVATSAVDGGEVREIVLEVRCPLHRGQPVLGGREVRIERKGGGAVPARWTPANLETCLLQLSELERNRRAPAERRRREEEERIRRQQYREAVENSLRQAAKIHTEQSGSLPEFLRLCGDAFINAFPPAVSQE